MEITGRIIGKSTPRFAKMISWKYSQLSGGRVREDMLENHGVKMSKKLIQGITGRVGEILIEKEDKYNYEVPAMDSPVEAIGISRDGTTVLIKGEGYKETMSGTISCYDGQGNRMHTIYTGCSPEHGKASFDYLFSQEIEGIKSRYPSVKYVGIADGEKGNWTFLGKYTDVQILDFFHATSYVGNYGKIVYSQSEERKKWVTESCSKLKNEKEGATQLLIEMSEYAQTHLIEDKDNPVRRAVTYFTNHQSKMDYPKYQEQNLPIGSGVVEAACKTLVKERFSKTGAKWTRTTVDHILIARGLILTKGRWTQFWKKFDRYG